MKNSPGKVNQWVEKHYIKSSQDVAFISGSRIEGFGNPTSDIDLFVIFHDNPDEPVGYPLCVFVDPIYIDVERYTSEKMSRLSSELNTLSLEDYDSIRSIPWNSLDLYYRTAIGKPSFNEEGFAALQANFSKDTVSALCHVRAGLQSISQLDKAQEHFRTGQLDLSFVAARSAAEWATDSFLAANGEAFPSRKWRFEKLKRKFGECSSEYTRAWLLKSRGTLDTESYIEACTQYCKEIGMYRFRLPETSPDTIKPQRESGSRLFQVGEEYYIIRDKFFIYYVNTSGKFIWDLLDGEKSLADLALHFSEEHGTSLTEASRHSSTFVQNLQDYGLIQAGHEQPIPKSATVGDSRPSRETSAVQAEIKRLPVSAGQFALSRFHAGKTFVIDYGLRLFDISGGKEAGQFGMIGVTSTLALEGGIDAFLASNGYEYGANADRLELLAQIFGNSSAVYTEAISLEREVPQTPEEIIAYADKCMHFVENTLEMGYFKKTFRLVSKQDWNQTMQIIYDLVTLMKYLGISSPISIEEAEELRASSTGDL